MSALSTLTFLSHATCQAQTAHLAQSTYDAQRLTWTAAVLAWTIAVPLFLLGRYVGTVAHEGGHALVAVLLFQSVQRIRIFLRGGGDMHYGGASTPWLVGIFVTLAGYLGPPTFGVAGAYLFSTGRTDLVLWSSFVFLGIMLLVTRNPFGLVLVPALMFGLYQIVTRTSTPLRELYTATWIWLLMIVGVQSLILVVKWHVYESESSDMGVLHRQTMLPAAFWAVAMLVTAIGELCWGGTVMLRAAM